MIFHVLLLLSFQKICTSLGFTCNSSAFSLANASGYFRHPDTLIACNKILKKLSLKAMKIYVENLKSSKKSQDFSQRIYRFHKLEGSLIAIY